MQVFSSVVVRSDIATWTAYRLNSSMRWQELDWPRFCEESRAIDEGERRLYEWIAYFEGDREPLEERLISEFHFMGRAYHMRNLTGHRRPREANLQRAAHGVFLRDTMVLEEQMKFDSNRHRQVKLGELRQQIAELMGGGRR